MQFTYSIAALALVCSSGCVTNVIDGSVGRGHLSLVGSEDAASQFVALSNTPVVGKACFNVVKLNLAANDPVVQLALSRALAANSDAVVLIDATIRDTGDCIEITGIPGKRK
jgi:hypothetical protein